MTQELSNPKIENKIALTNHTNPIAIQGVARGIIENLGDAGLVVVYTVHDQQGTLKIDQATYRLLKLLFLAIAEANEGLMHQGIHDKAGGTDKASLQGRAAQEAAAFLKALQTGDHEADKPLMQLTLRLRDTLDCLGIEWRVPTTSDAGNETPAPLPSP